MNRTALMLAAVLLWCASAAPIQAHSDTDLRRLARVICAVETRGKPEPDREVGTVGELGRCQIKATTAVMVNIHPFDLEDPETSLIAATRWLWLCHKRGWRGDYWLAYCYNRGPSAGRRIDAGHRYAARLMIAVNQTLARKR